MFNQQWFQKHQRILLWFANTWFGKRILCINGDRSSVGKNKIIGIMPNAIFWAGKKKGYHFIKGKKVNRLEYVAEFRTHDKFGKRLFYAFKPIWYLIHFWDTLFANNFQPAWNLGFDTLTVYPDPDPETTTVDGLVRRQPTSETLATIRAGAGTGFADNAASTTHVRLVASGTTNEYNDLIRFIYLFDTTTLPDDATINSATFSLFGTNKVNGLGSPDLHLTSSTPASNTTLANADYSQLGATSFGSVTYANYSTTAYNDMALNASGLSNISKTGVSKFGARTDWDINNNFTGTWASGGDSRLDGYAADQTGTTNDPKLVITFSISSGFLAFM